MKAGEHKPQGTADVATSEVLKWADAQAVTPGRHAMLGPHALHSASERE